MKKNRRKRKEGGIRRGRSYVRSNYCPYRTLN